MPASPLTLSLLTLSLLSGCNSYELFRVTGFEQASFSNDADILFVVDNSISMQPHAEGLANNFGAFIGKLTNADTGSAVPTETLGDAVSNYIRETTGESLFIDFQLAITTSSVYYDEGKTGSIDPGEAGTLAYDSDSETPPVIGRSAPDANAAFTTNLLCESTCWASTTPADLEYECGQPFTGTYTKQYLDCLCGLNEWQGNCGSGTEQPIEAAFLALCRATPNPPDDCYVHPPGSALNVFDEGVDEGTNDGLLREGANTLVVVVTDEGDSSLRTSEGEGAAGPDDIEFVVDEYADLFAEFPNLVRFAVIGPAWDDVEKDGSCLNGAQQPGVERYFGLVEATNGLYIPLTKIDRDCTPNNFGESLDQLGTLLSSLKTFFPLQAIPDVATIEVFVNFDEVARAETLPGTEASANPTYLTGWSYDASENAVSFHGEAIPAYDADVRIYYRALGGMPRTLPF